MARRRALSAVAARRIALAAQGFADPRPAGRVDRRHLRRVLDRMGVIQIDSVNVLVRSQELPLFARLGPHPRSLIPDATDDGELFEYWVHEASHVPTEHHHLHRWRMQLPHRWRPVERLKEERPGFVDEVYRFVEENGPIAAGELAARERPKAAWWDWDDAKVALEHLFHAGAVTARRRRSDFARLYDLTERVLPAEVLARPAPDERAARTALLDLAARSCGVATLGDLADYHRQRIGPLRPLVHELVEEGRLIEVEVEGWDRIGYLHAEARRPRSVDARALLSPFDPVVWNRDRALRLFGFHYRIEIYVSPAKRRYGYYVLPVLLGDELVARVDLKADRQRRVLRVQSAWIEPHVLEREGPPWRVASELATELTSMASWLELESVEVTGRGDLSSALARCSGVATAPT